MPYMGGVRTWERFQVERARGGAKEFSESRGRRTHDEPMLGGALP
jgi:hypothetical protein